MTTQLHAASVAAPDPFIALSVALKSKEGGYTNDPADKGGETNHGITVFVARAFGYEGPMRALTWETALLIYRQRYWVEPGFDRLHQVDARLAARLFDIGVNMGQSIGIIQLQRTLNVLNQQGSDYPDMTVDGRLGPMTLAAARTFIAKRGQDGRRVLFGIVAALHSVRYVEIAEGNPTQERFQYGWQAQRALPA